MKQPTRAQRFLQIRDAIMARSSDMRINEHGAHELVCGPFMIFFLPLGACGPGRGFNLQIWPSGAVDAGMMIHGDKVANVDWFPDNSVHIFSYRSGTW